MLTKLVQGEIAGVESYWMEQLIMNHNVDVPAAKWKAALPHMYFWGIFQC